MAGVNAELMPWVRMTQPKGVSIAELGAAVGESSPGFCFHSWLLLDGVLPIDRHALTIETLYPGVGFDEESTSWLQHRWRHERRITDEPDGGCTVTDTLEAQPRLRLAEPLVRLILKRVFTHRHRRLRRRY